MKLAHLLLAHTYPDHLEKLISRLSYEDTHFYIHLDKKTDIAPFLFLAEKPNVFFIKKRVKVSWAGYSMVQATVNSFEEILASGKEYDYINLMSGQDYPIKSNAYIHKFLSDNNGKIFMHTLSVTDEWHEAIPRFTKYHLVNFTLPGKYAAEKIINTILPSRKTPGNLTLAGRSQWFTATPASVKYILQYLKEHPEVVRYFKLSWAPDESIFQTILYNSPLKKDMVNNNLLYVDWSSGAASPKLLTIADKDLLTQSDKLFARKFAPPADTEILNYLDTVIS